jgi:hypothetical protein
MPRDLCIPASQKPSLSIDGRLSNYSLAANAANVSSIAISIPDTGKNSGSQEIHGRSINLISLAAIATGLGVMAFAVPAEGKVVVTKTNLPINGTNSLLPPTSIDLNHDGVADLEFGQGSFISAGTFQIAITGKVFNGGAVTTSPHSYVAALKHGAGIGPSAQFGNGYFDVEVSNGRDKSSHPYSQHLVGNWGGNPTNRFMGVKFLIDGQTHYGWVRLQIKTGKGKFLSGTITGYAYETIANKKLEAGVSSNDPAEETSVGGNRSSLGMLALGFDGLAMWRRENAVDGIESDPKRV